MSNSIKSQKNHRRNISNRNKQIREQIKYFDHLSKLSELKTEKRWGKKE